MNKDFLRFLKPVTHLSRNGFDNSRRDIFSTKVGLKQPCFVLDTVLNDYHEIKPVNMIRTMPFNDANFVRMKQHMDFFFVPYTALFSEWNTYYQQTVDPMTSMDKLSQVTNTSSFGIRFDTLLDALLYARCVDIYCKVNNVNKVPAASINTLYVNSNAYDYYIRIQAQIGNSRRIFVEYDTSGNASVRKDMFGYPVYLGTVRLLDMLGYGNLLPLINNPVLDISTQQEQGLDYAIYAFVDKFYQKYVSLLRLLAYQKVCDDYFRNFHYEVSNPLSYNIDDCFHTGANGLSVCEVRQPEDITPIFTMHYSLWKHDIFMSALSSPQFGVVSKVDVFSDTLYKVGTESTSTGSGQLYHNNGTIRIANAGGDKVGTRGGFNIIDFRKAEALQWWKEQVNRAGNKAKDRFKATFGETPSFDHHITALPIGSYTSDVQKDVVTGMSGEDFAQQKATGSSVLSNGDVIKFHSPAFGVIIGLLSIIPEADYDAYMIDKENFRFEPFDFFTPAFQNLGLEPIIGSQLSIFNADGYTPEPAPDQVLGYVPRYSEYKQAVDKIHGEFCSSPAYIQRDMPQGQSLVGQFESFVSKRLDYQNFIAGVGRFYVDPAIVNSIFLTDADESQSTDQFLVTLYTEVKSVRPMSVLGLPQ